MPLRLAAMPRRDELRCYRYESRSQARCCGHTEVVLVAHAGEMLGRFVHEHGAAQCTAAPGSGESSEGVGLLVET